MLAFGSTGRKPAVAAAPDRERISHPHGAGIRGRRVAGGGGGNRTRGPGFLITRDGARLTRLSVAKPHASVTRPSPLESTGVPWSPPESWRNRGGRGNGFPRPRVDRGPVRVVRRATTGHHSQPPFRSKGQEPAESAGTRGTPSAMVARKANGLAEACLATPLRRKPPSSRAALPGVVPRSSAAPTPVPRDSGGSVPSCATCGR